MNIELPNKPEVKETKNLSVVKLNGNTTDKEQLKNSLDMLTFHIQKLEEVKEQYKYYRDCINKIIETIPDNLSVNWQDNEGTVYQIVKPSGTFIEFKERDYVRTRKLNEKKGSLSLTAAKELGYEVK